MCRYLARQNLSKIESVCQDRGHLNKRHKIQAKFLHVTFHQFSLGFSDFLVPNLDLFWDVRNF